MMKWRIYSSLYWSGVSTCDPGTSCQHFLDTTLNISFSRRLSLLGAWREGVEESFIRDELNYNISTHIRHWAKHRWEEQSLWIDPLEEWAVFDCLEPSLRYRTKPIIRLKLSSATFYDAVSGMLVGRQWRDQLDMTSGDVKTQWSGPDCWHPSP